MFPVHFLAYDGEALDIKPGPTHLESQWAVLCMVDIQSQAVLWQTEITPTTMNAE